ncbi:MAG: lipid-A-disaccharide synthase, partial [Myxococcota bacterium]|jgi:lipid-A-disaccharide synthase
MTTLLISAGDASGDLHAADFVRAFRRAHPDTRFVGMGGDAMESAGVELVVHQRELAVGGLFEIASSLPRIVAVWRKLNRALVEAKPNLAVLVDSGGIHIPFAKRIRRQSGAKILYFIAPQVWAWRPGRIAKLAARIDRMALIFPFEPKVYSETSLPVDFVGHPLAEPLSALAASTSLEDARAAVGCRVDESDAKVVALFPGSRRNEIEHHLPVQLAACATLHRQIGNVDFVLAGAPSVDRGLIEQTIARAGLPEALSLKVVYGKSREAMLACDVAIAKPGTVTVELALLERPMVVIGKVNRATALILRRNVLVPYYAMPNIILEREVVPELLQEDAKPDDIAKAVAALFSGPMRDRQLKDLLQVKNALSKTGAASRTSEIAQEMLAGDS